MNTRQTSKSVASKASKILSNPKSTKTHQQRLRKVLQPVLLLRQRQARKVNKPV